MHVVSPDSQPPQIASNDMKEALLESEFPETYAAMGSLVR
tara:strand:+ start:644 stop:763 length:120 start_codon:yes stop_codon:yes gene_type:complete